MSNFEVSNAFGSPEFNTARVETAVSLFRNYEYRDPQELEKTPLDYLAISKASEMLGEAIVGLGLPSPQPLQPDRIHMYSGKIFAAKFLPHDKPTGVTYALSNEIEIDHDEATTNVSLLELLLHEGIHMYAYPRFAVNDGEIVSASSGYRFGKNDTFSEGITQRFTEQVLQTNKGKLPFYEDAAIYFEKKASIYQNEMALIDIILKKISAKYGVPETDTSNFFIKHLFTGQHGHLLTIDETFGTDSWIILNEWDTRDNSNSSNGLIFRYFATDNQAEREDIASQLIANS